MRKKRLCDGLVILLIAAILVVAHFFWFRFDLTQEKRFSIAPQTKELIKNLDTPITIACYLGGPVDANVAHLKSSMINMVEEFNSYSSTRIRLDFINPSIAESDDERIKNYVALEQRGMRGLSVAHKEKNGTISQSVVFPWAYVVIHNDSLLIPLIENNSQASTEELISHSIEDLEFKLTDAIRSLSKQDIDKVAFIEGHGELEEEFVYDAESALSRYFQIDRGSFTSDATALDNYKAIVIAQPKEKFSEADKYIIDQYFMNGGRVLWLIDGIEFSEKTLAKSGISPILPLDVNLQDMLFKYGVRILPSVLEDMQCAYTPINIAPIGQPAQFEALPWFYAPLLITSPYHPITKNSMQVKANFASALEFTNNSNDVTKDVLLVTSNATRISKAPTEINLSAMTKIDPQTYFNTHYLPVAVAMQGFFPSVFTHRMMPTTITNSHQKKDVSQKTRMIVVADGDIIKNELENKNNSVGVIPLGYDRVTKQLFGNKNFIVNSLLYLTDDENWLSLRNRTIKLRLINQAVSSTNRTFWQCINVLFPLLLLGILGSIYLLVRRHKNKIM
ncbi:MAG: gliding motility-associated ABC transporter substrate-binding protein GldG [Sphingobacteriia bacterium]|jgi:ABC-2 type transport system permease protein|nr:gliding motility-associated ABC transporter substrate-binding protein GldG [Paludibacteraceae bacterium]NCA78633.1 gliding motility-associated ABC transporter substrate-binding protein GldG [Sphingobacteriia bacterium]